MTTKEEHIIDPNSSNDDGDELLEEHSYTYENDSSATLDDQVNNFCEVVSEQLSNTGIREKFIMSNGSYSIVFSCGESKDWGVIISLLNQRRDLVKDFLTAHTFRDYVSSGVQLSEWGLHRDCHVYLSPNSFIDNLRLRFFDLTGFLI